MEADQEKTIQNLLYLFMIVKLIQHRFEYVWLNQLKETTEQGIQKNQEQTTNIMIF